MSKVSVPGGQVPLRTLVRSFDLRIFTIIDVFARLEPPHGRAQPELNPHTLPLRLSAAEYLVQSSARTSSIVPPPRVSRAMRNCPVADMKTTRWWPWDLPSGGHQRRSVRWLALRAPWLGGSGQVGLGDKLITSSARVFLSPAADSVVLRLHLSSVLQHERHELVWSIRW